MISAVLLGGGRMARSIREVAATGGVDIVGVVSPHRPDWVAADAHAERLEDLAVPVDVLIDFSLPAGTRTAAVWCRDGGVPLLSGVTGLGDEAFAALERAAGKVPVLWAPNLSLGVNLLEALCRETAAALDPACRVQVHDVHHRWKKDAPSGTALALGAAVESARPDGAPRVAYRSDREGEVVGRHVVRFEWDGEVLELAHEALDRSVFARGAVDAARWLCRQSPGRYHARDWLASR